MLETLRRNVTWRAIPIAGIVAGTVFLAVMLILTAIVYQMTPTHVLRYMAALALGSGVLTEASTGTLIAGVLVHFAISIAVALLIAIVVHRGGMATGIIGGAILGLAIYGINIYTITRFFEWFFAINGPVLLAAHVLFGAVAGGLYEYYDHFDLPSKEKDHV